MVKYRFKTKEEFIRDGQWNNKHDRPFGWNSAGRMNRFLGQDIPEKYNEKCDKELSIFIDDWHFTSSDYVLKETKRVNTYTDFVFIPGNIYVGEWDSKRVIFKPFTSCLEDPCNIIDSDDNYTLNQRGCCNSNGISFREANQEEKDWLEACIKANTTVPKPSNSIPEYVECIEEFPPNYGEKGKIYKVITWKYSPNDCVLEGTTSGSTDRSRFKPSTKEAYDAQNAPVIDKWAIKCTEENKEHLEKFFHNKGLEYKGYKPSWTISIGYYYHYPQSGKFAWGWFETQKGYREITNEEFYKIAGVVTDIPSTPTFKQGDYIVITKSNDSFYNGDLNHCYKLINDDFHIGDYDRIPLDQHQSKKARLATPEEIAEYDRLGEPYDVRTLLQKQSSIPQYVKCINGYGGAIIGQVYCTDDNEIAEQLFGITWEQVLIEYNHLGTKFIPVTSPEYSKYHYEKVEQSKPSLDGGYPIKKETLIEDVHSVSVMLCTKNKLKQFKF